MNNYPLLGNFINNFLNQNANKLSGNNSIAQTNIAKVLAQPASAQTQASVQNVLNSVSNFNSALLTAKEMDSAQKTVVVKELFNLPQDLKSLLDFIQTLNKDTQNTQFVQQKFSSGLLKLENLNIQQLMALLQTNGKEAQNKIMQLMTLLNKNGNVDTKQLKELLFVINACIPQENTTATQFMKNILLLYLPWLPLGENNNFDLDITEKKHGSDGENAETTVSILIKTKNFGNVKVLLSLQSANTISMQIHCSKFFPNEKLEQQIQQEAKDYQIQAEIAIEEHSHIEKEQSPTQNTERQVHINGASVLNPYLLLMTHAVIKAVIGLDKAQSLKSDRQKMLETTTDEEKS